MDAHELVARHLGPTDLADSTVRLSRVATDVPLGYEVFMASGVRHEMLSRRAVG